MGRIARVAGLVFAVLLSFCLFVEVPVFGASLPLPEENVWVEIAPMRHARSHFGTVVIDGKILCCWRYC